MKPLEDGENFLVVFRFNPYAIVGHGEPQLPVALLDRDVNPRRLRSAVLDGVPDQVLKQRDKMRLVRVQSGQIVGSNHGIAVDDGRFQILPDLLHHGV